MQPMVVGQTGSMAPMAKLPGHWVLAQLGKRVLRPGGMELTKRLLDDLKIGVDDDVVEFAPGLGVTARLALACFPRSYVAVERDAVAAAALQESLDGETQLCVACSAEHTHLPGSSASVVYGEAMLSMQPDSTKQRIVSEAFRLLRPDGRYGIHELCLVPDDIDDASRAAVARDLSHEVHVGVRAYTVREWRQLLNQAGFRVVSEQCSPMRLLEPARIVADEGWPNALRFAWNLIRQGTARQRVLAMRSAFRKHREKLAAVALVCVKETDETESR